MKRLLILALLGLAACATTEVSTPVVAGQSVCAAHLGAGTTHNGDITADETWTAAGSPHLVAADKSITAGATLTLEPCAEVRMGAGTSLLAFGKLLALGDATHPITIAAENPTKPFDFVTVRPGGWLDFAYVRVAGGAAGTVNGSGVIDVWGPGAEDGVAPTAAARLRHVTIDGSDHFGLTLERAGTLTPDSDDLTISHCALGAISTRPALASAIPAGKYTGNAVDGIVVISSDIMTTDTTWHDRGVPYIIGEANGNGHDFRVGLGGGTRVRWTIDPGVVIRVQPAGRVLMQAAATGKVSNGVVIATGTAAKPIVFTSAAAAAAPGDWRGLVWDGAPDSANTLAFVHVEYAGGDSQANSFHCDPNGSFSNNENAAIAFFGEPAAPFVQNSTILASAGAGIDLAYSGNALDFLSGNTFSQVAGCKVTTPRDAKGSCPATAPCP